MNKAGLLAALLLAPSVLGFPGSAAAPPLDSQGQGPAALASAAEPAGPPPTPTPTPSPSPSPAALTASSAAAPGLLLSPTATPPPTPAPPADPAGLDSYRQSLQLSFPGGADPAGVSVTVAPLWHDAKWAFTQRWDDNLIDSMRVRDLLIRRHMRGTFYLNASEVWYFNESHYPLDGDPSLSLGKALRKGGNSIGGHTLTHNFVPDLNRQEIFWETMAVRIDREVNTQSPINSFVFPFLEFRNRLEKEAVHDDLASILLRDGYIHVADQYFNQPPSRPTGLLDSWLLPCDGGGDVDAEVKRLLRSNKQQQREPILCMCMHAWPAKWGGPAFPDLDRVFRHWHGRSIWWYPNANELAAYRYQAIHGSLQARAVSGTVQLGLDRFEPWDLGDPVALTLKVRGAGDEPPVATSDGQPLKVWRGRDKTAWLVELPHPPGHAMPDLYDWHRNHSNHADGLDDKGKGVIDGLASRLWLQDGNLHLKLVNRGADLQGLRLEWRLPLGYAGAPCERREALKSGQSLDLALPLRQEGGPLLRQGKLYAAVQLDARRGDQRLRLYSDVRAQVQDRDPSFPKGGFLVLGPLPGDRKDFDLQDFAQKVMARAQPRPCEDAFDQQSPCWQETPPQIAGPLHPEIIPAGGLMAPRTFYTWDDSLFYAYGHKLHYLLLGDIVSPVSRMARAVFPKAGVRRMVLNGRRVKGSTLSLRAGANRLELLYTAHTADADGQGTFSERNYGPYFRLVDAAGQRLTDIEYRMPEGLSRTAQP